MHALPSLGPDMRRRRNMLFEPAAEQGTKVKLDRKQEHTADLIGQRMGLGWVEQSRGGGGVTQLPGNPFSTFSSEKENLTAPRLRFFRS